MRSAVILVTVLSALLSNFQALADDCSSKIDQELGPKLSPKASIVHFSSAAPRWSDYHAPRPGTIVNVAEEQDVVATVKYCIKHNLDFLVQSGGHGWGATFNIGEKDVLINMRGMNQVTVNEAKDKITFEGGALVGEVLEAAYQNQVQSTIPSCDCIGMSGAALGGGYNRFIGHYGLVVDNILSINLVTAQGHLTTVTPKSSPDLWWALRGAGANFGAVTSITMKAYPQINNGMGWMGYLIYSADKIEDFMKLFANFHNTEDMFFFIFFTADAPDFVPIITANLFYAGPEAEAKIAFKAFYDLGPIADNSGEVPYNQFNVGFAGFCTKGKRKPTYTAGLKKVDVKAFRKIWAEFIALISPKPELLSVVLVYESWSPEKVRTFSKDSAAFAHRDLNYLTILSVWYEDPKMDVVAERFCSNVVRLWKESSGFKDFRAYVNYGHGDEGLEAIYGESLSRLKKIKKRWDKDGRFSQFFAIPNK